MKKYRSIIFLLLFLPLSAWSDYIITNPENASDQGLLKKDEAGDWQIVEFSSDGFIRYHPHNVTIDVENGYAYIVYEEGDDPVEFILERV